MVEEVVVVVVAVLLQKEEVLQLEEMLVLVLEVVTVQVIQDKMVVTNRDLLHVFLEVGFGNDEMLVML